MPSDFERTVISKPGSAIKEIKIELPDYLTMAITESLERGKQAAREKGDKITTPPRRRLYRLCR